MKPLLQSLFHSSLSAPSRLYVLMIQHRHIILISPLLSELFSEKKKHSEYFYMHHISVDYALCTL